MFDDTRRSSEHVSWTSFVAAHRGHASRRRHRDGRDRVLVFARDATVLRWVEHELFGEQVSSTVVTALGDVVAHLTLTPPPWSQYLIVDAAELSPVDVALLGAIRQAGWGGVVIAIGDACDTSRQALGIDVVLPRCFGNELLRNALKQAMRDRRV